MNFSGPFWLFVVLKLLLLQYLLTLYLVVLVQSICYVLMNSKIALAFFPTLFLVAQLPVV